MNKAEKVSDAAMSENRKRGAPEAEDPQASAKARLDLLCSILHGHVEEPLDDDLDKLIAAVSEDFGDEQEDEGFAANYDVFGAGHWWEEASNSTDFGKLDKDGLPDDLISEAMAQEIQSFKDRGVYEVVDRSELGECANPVMLSTKWVLKNKGTKEAPVAKARLVAREFVSKAIDRDSLFSGTPGLPAMRFLVSRTVSSRGGRRSRYRLMAMDVKTAFLYGRATRDLFIELPSSDPASKDANKIGRLIKSLYGTRDAPQRWAAECAGTLEKLGFVESRVVPSVFVHVERDTLLTLHVDDFLVSAEEDQLVWLRDSLKQHYELKAQIIGPEDHLGKSVEYLQRTIKWEDDGVTVESDQRHVKELVRTMGMETCKVVNTPLTAQDMKDEPTEKPELEASLNAQATRRFRRGAAIAVYLSQDRPDIAAASCHLARKMSAPNVRDEEKLRRVTRYLRGRPRGLLRFKYQEESTEIVVTTDSDWANDSRSRRSHSGGVIQIGNHLISHWCRIQGIIALSSGEAELYASITGITRALGVLHLGRSLWGESWGSVRHRVDSAACKSIISRKGSGSLKHLSTKDMWVQEAVRRYQVVEEKIPREINSADMLASYTGAKSMDAHLERLNCEVFYFARGR